MKITLKHILLTSIALFGALMFLIGLLVPETVSFTFNSKGTAAYVPPLPAGEFSGSLLSVANVTKEQFVKAALLGDYKSLGLFGAVYYDIAVLVMLGQQSAGSGVYEAAYILASVYQVLAVIGLVICIICIVAAIGAFFIPSMKGARGLTIPFFALLFIWAGVMMGILALPGASTLALNDSATYKELFQIVVKRSAPGIIFMVISMIAFVGMLIAPGVVKEKVLVGKKD